MHCGLFWVCSEFSAELHITHLSRYTLRYTTKRGQYIHVIMQWTLSQKQLPPHVWSRRQMARITSVPKRHLVDLNCRRKRTYALTEEQTLDPFLGQPTIVMSLCDLAASVTRLCHWTNWSILRADNRYTSPTVAARDSSLCSVPWSETYRKIQGGFQTGVCPTALSTFSFKPRVAAGHGWWTSHFGIGCILRHRGSPVTGIVAILQWGKWPCAPLTSS